MNISIKNETKSQQVRAWHAKNNENHHYLPFPFTDALHPQTHQHPNKKFFLVGGGNNFKQFKHAMAMKSEKSGNKTDPNETKFL